MIVRHDGGKREIWSVWTTLAATILATRFESSAGSAAARSVLGAVTPETLGLGEEVMIRWSYDDGNGDSYGRFDVDLYQCSDPFCGMDDCGEFVSNICDKPEIGCSDAGGNFPMTIPMSMTPHDGYKIRVGLHGSELFDCTSTFAIVEDIPVPSIEVFAPEVVVGGESSTSHQSSSSTVVESVQVGYRGLQSSSSPTLEGGSWYAGGNHTISVRWTYDDGRGGSFARFNIDLYYCGGGCEVNDNCGQAVARLCEACPDSSGDEMVKLPDPYSSHNYKIRVSTWEGVRRSVSACSPKFEIRGRERPEYSTPSPTHEYVERLPDPSGLGRPDPVADLPTQSVVRPTDYPDWGTALEALVQPGCGTATPPEVRYASTTKRIYLERRASRGGCFTLTEIWETGNKPLYPVDPDTNERTTSPTGVWLLTEELFVSHGIILQVHGTARGGDCDELRLLSNETTILNLRAHGGSLSFLGTKVTSWDEGKGTVDTNHEDGRSYISALSEVIYDPELTCAGMAEGTMGESRMDVIDSEIGYLGYYESESYGLVWKVRGFCTDKSNEEVFDEVNVYGDIINSNIHHNYFGMYSYGHQGGNWSFNKMHDNVMYGFDPHDDSDYLTIHGNDVWGNGNHGIIASKRCDHVRITDNHVSYGVSAGIFLHRSSDYAVVSGNHVHDNGDAGLAVLESFYMDVGYNVFKDNLYGVRFSVGAGYNWVHENTVANSERYNVYTYLGSDAPEVEGTSGFPIGNVIWRNYISGTQYSSIKLKEAELTVVVNNRIRGASTVEFDDSIDTTYRDNEEEEGLEGISKGYACFTADSDLDPVC